MSKTAPRQSKIMPRPKAWKDVMPSYPEGVELRHGSPSECPNKAVRKGLRSKGLKSSPLRDSARGELCTLQIAGACNQDSETVVLCHLPFLAGAGMGQKAPDFCAAYGCSGCHDALDGRTMVMSYDERIFYGARGLVRTLARMAEKGLIKISGMTGR